MAKDAVYLNCPYDEKDDAKALGAWWDAGKKKWYVPAGVDEAPFSRWMSGAVSKPKNNIKHQGKAFSDFVFE